MQEAITKQGNSANMPIWHISALLLAFILTETILLQFYGIRSSWDSSAYLSNAESVLQGQGISKDYLGYGSYIYYLATQLFMRGGDTRIALGQIILAGISVLAFYQTTIRILTPSFSFWVSMVFALWPTLRYWDAYLYTESVYISMITICLYLTIRIRERSISYYWLIPFLLFTSFVRPPALLFTLSLLLASVTLPSHKTSLPTWVTYSLFSFATAALVLFLFTTEHVEHLLLSYNKGEVIYPNVCLILPSDVDQAPNLSSFILHSPLWFLKLGLVKLWYFLSGTKPHYSLMHNSLAFISNTLLYSFSLLSVWYKSWKKEELVLIISFFIGNILMVVITAENWDGRFHLPLIPFLLLLSAKGLERLFYSLVNKNTLFS